ncbi:hypothetical protein EASAB2608_06516 [Streptomyces sp. EAS-AB2608]|uniref:hypothetical protein n=1 Tax=Streptomyces sp. EAS-AB2608 TaxID=2779671 RepID=UPI001BEDA07A|nr:hypothetical protein [Streptomyces sp. EAS-AB2608]BCM71182.1 hypothetical protein EASAB2608_06516 [Streptomyces sp. EAS-AB2608]
MSDPLTTGQGPVGVHYHQFLVTDPGGPVAEDETDASHTGLVGITAGDATVHTGIHTGDVDVTVTAHRQPPPPDAGEWEEIAEISLHSPTGTLQVTPLMTDLDEDLPDLAAAGPGTYRLRVHARGRDQAVDLAPDTITEHYLLQCWPQPPAPAQLLRATDDYGSRLRAEQTHQTRVTTHTPRGQHRQEHDILRRSLGG